MKKNNSKIPFEKTRDALKSLAFKFKSLSFVKHILFFYLFITVIGSLILLLPISQKDGTNVEYLDTLFTSASAFSDTGLVTVTTAVTWSYFGQAIIAILILVGGVGWFALKIYLFNILLGRPLSFRSRSTLAGERGSSKIGNTRRLIKVSVTFLLILVVVATFILTLYFYFTQPDADPFGYVANGTKDPDTGKLLASSGSYIMETPYHDVATSFRYGLFHAISGLNNAGFDIMGAHSLEGYYHKYALQIIFITLFVIGGIGYPVLYDLYMWARSKFTGEKFRWSLFTKISMTAYTTIVIIGLSSAFAMEVPRSGGFWDKSSYGSNGDKTMALIFNTMSTRNAGFGTVEIDDLSKGTVLIYAIMMFIGSAPSSTAGGIRTTTIAIVILSLWARIRGHSAVRVFNRRINPDTVARANIVTAAALFILIVGTLIMITSWSSYGGAVDEKHGFTDLMFETSSAFGTTGLSTGITPDLSIASKITLILIMFIGQLGVSSTLLVWDSKKNKKRKYKLVEADVTIG